MLDKLVDFGSGFDWITPLVAAIKDRVHGPAHTFLIPEDCGRSARSIENLLRDRGIKTWGLMFAQGMIMITVRLAQAWWAQYLLERARIPIAYGLLEERPPSTASPRRKQKSTESQPSAGPWPDKLVDYLEELVLPQR